MGSRLKTLALIVIAILALVVPSFGSAKAEGWSGGPLSACAVRGHTPNGCPVNAQSVSDSRGGSVSHPFDATGGGGPLPRSTTGSRGGGIAARPFVVYDGSPITQTVQYTCFGVGYRASATMYIQGWKSGPTFGYVWYFYIPMTATNVVQPLGVEVHYAMSGCSSKFSGTETASPTYSFQHSATYTLTSVSGSASYPWTQTGAWGTTGTLTPGL